MFVIDPASRVVFGEGALRRVPEEVGRLGLSRVLFVHSGRDARAADTVRLGLGSLLAGEFTAVRPHVPVEVADAAARTAGECAADGLVCLGGGSVTGTAKAVALRTGLPIVAVPTSYAGSEVTAVWGLTAAGRKQTGNNPTVRPTAVIYDPELTAELPAEVSATSGLNAMAHAVEAFWAPGRTPMTALHAAEAVRLLAEHLPAIAADGHDRPARAAALFGSYLAGAAFAVAGSGLHHKICHVLGGTWNLPHAATHSVVLPYVLAWNAARSPTAVRALTGTDDGVPSAGVGALVGLARRIGAPASLAELGFAAGAVPEAAALVAPVVPADNPRPAGEPELRLILRCAQAGTDPMELVEE